MAELNHLYVAFWRPDILAELQSRGAVCATVCEIVVEPVAATCDTRLMTCPACRETFLSALPTGDGKKLTWAEYAKLETARPIRTLKQQATEADLAASGWRTPESWRPFPGAQTEAMAVPPPGWSSEVAPVSHAAWESLKSVKTEKDPGWTSPKAEPPGSPVWDGWGTGNPWRTR